MNWYIKVIRQYSDFNGRARRTEYWVFTIVNAIFSLSLALVDTLIIRNAFGTQMIYSLFVLIPGLAVTVRRLHDVGKNGWWVLVGFIPLVGWLWLLFFLLKDSDPETNIYGTNPKEET